MLALYLVNVSNLIFIVIYEKYYNNSLFFKQIANIILYATFISAKQEI